MNIILSQIMKAFVLVILSLVFTTPSFANIENDKVLLKRFNNSLDRVIDEFPKDDIQIADLFSIEETLQTLQADHSLLKHTLKRISENSSLNDTISGDIDVFISALNEFYKKSAAIEESSSITSLWHELVRQYHFYSILWNLISIKNDIDNRHHFILHNRLPINPSELFDNALTLGDIQPSYKTQIDSNPELNSTELPTPNALIVNKVRELNNDPIAIYAFVTSTIIPEVYTGTRKSAVATLMSGAGNDIDQAILLQALFNAAGIKSHLVTGVSRAPISYLNELWNLEGKNNLIRLLRASGQKFEPLYVQNEGEHILWQHTWVSAQVQYDSYRGAKAESTELSWIALDPYQAISTTDNIITTLPSDTDIDILWKQQLTQSNGGSFLQLLSQKIITDQELTPLLELEDEQPKINYLPASLQLESERIIHEGQNILTEYDNRLNFEIISTNNGFDDDILSKELSIAELYNRNISISFEGATPEDQQTLLSSGGINNTLLSDVRLKMVVRIDNEIIAFSDEAVAAGDVLTIRFRINNATKTQFEKHIIAGSFYSLGVGGGAIAKDASQLSNWPNTGAGTRLLSHSAYSYLDSVHKDNLALGQLLGHKVIYPQPTFTFVSNRNKINYLIDQPAFLDWTGVEMDALFQPTASINAKETPFTQAQFVKSSALNSSWHEQNTFEVLFELDSISADEAIAAAFTKGELLTNPTIEVINSTQHNATTKDALISHVNAGHDLYASTTPLEIDKWKGTAWVATDPLTGASGYYLSGGIAGSGNTGLEGNENVWALIDPKSAMPEEGDDRVGRLIAFYDSNSTGIAGKNESFRIQAVSSSNSPIINATIKLKVRNANAGIGRSQGSNNTEYTAITDASGYIDVVLTFGESTEINSVQYYIEGDRYPTRMGEIIIDAWVNDINTPISLDFPIIKYFGPDAPIDGIIQVSRTEVYALSMDQYGNPVSNVEVTVTANGIERSLSEEYVEDFDNGSVGINGLANQDTSSTITTRSELSYINSIYPGGYCATEYKFNVSIDSGPSEDFIREKVCSYRIRNDINLNDLEEVDLGIGTCIGQPESRYKTNGPSGKHNVHILTTPQQTQQDAITVHTSMCTGIALREKEDYPELRHLEDAIAYVLEIPVDGSPDDLRIYTETGEINVKHTGNKHPIDVTGTSLGRHQIKYSDYTHKIYGTPPVNVASYYTVQPNLTAPDEISTREISPGNFVTSANINLGYSLLGAPDTIGKKPLVILYEEENPIAVFYSPTLTTSGNVIIPTGTPLDIENRNYFVELVVYQGYSATEIRSDKVKLTLPLLSLESKNVKFTHKVNLSLRQACSKEDAIIEFSLFDNANVKITLQKILGPSGELFYQSPIELHNANFPRGKHNLAVSAEGISPGEYLATLQAQSEDGLQNEIAEFNVSVKANKEDTLPIAHAIYDDIDLHDGSLNLRRTDLSIPYDNLDFGFSRQYNSQTTADSYLGRGWTDLNLHTLTETACGYTIANGMRFTRVNGKNIPSIGVHAELSSDGKNYDLYTKAGVRYHYRQYPFNRNNQWLVEYIQQPSGQILSYSYDLESYDQIRIASIEDGNGRSFVYKYDTYSNSLFNSTEKRLASIEITEEAELRFNYDEILRLKSVELERDGKAQILESYEYVENQNVSEEKKELDGTYPNPEESYPQTITDLQYGLTLKNERIGLITAIIDAEGERTLFEYTPKLHTLYSETDPIFSQFENPVVSKITDRRGTDTNFSYDFEDNSNADNFDDVISTVTITGAEDLDLIYGLNGYGSLLEITDVIGTEFTTWNPEHLLPQSKTDKKGFETSYDYDEFGNLINKTYSLDGDMVTEIFEYLQLPTYYSEGKSVFKTALLSHTDGADREIKYEYKNKYCPFPTKQSYPETFYSYGEYCRLKTKSDANSNTYAYEYDEYGYRSKLNGPKPVSNKSLSERYTYNALGELTQTQDFDKITTKYDNNIFGKPLTIYRALGHETSFTYDKLGQKRTQTDSVGRVTTFDYDEEGNLKSEKRLRGGESGDQLVTRNLTYTLRNQLETEQDWNGNITTYHYDEANRLDGILLPLNKRITYKLDKNGNRETETFSLGAGRTSAISRTFNEQNQLATETDAEDEVQIWKYDKAGNTLIHTGKNGLVTTNAYDDYNRKITTTQSGTPARRTSFEYDLNGWLTKQTEDPGGNDRITTQKYDELGRVIETIIRQGSDQASTIRNYDPLGNLLSEIDPVGAKIRNEYDSLYRLKTSYNALGEETGYEYDLAGRLLEQRNPNGNNQTFAYNASDLNNLHEDSISLVSRSTYDFQGNLKTITDGRGNTSRYDYNELHQQTTHTLATNGTYIYTYNHQDQILTETDPLQAKRTLTYNKRGDLLTEQDFNLHTSTYTRDSLGNPKTLTDALGHITQYDYNDYGELSTITDPLFNQLFEYDDLGRRTKSTDQRGIETKIDYNFLDLTTRVIRDTQLRQENSYYPDGQLSETFDGESNRTFFEYDALKRTTLESGELLAITQYQHDTADRTRKITSPDGVTTDETYDKRGNLKITTTDGAQTEFEYDLVNNQKRMLLPEGNDVNYTYDALNRLETITDGENNITGFVFDDIGLKRSHTDGKGIQTDFDYDDNGNLKSITYAKGVEKELTTSFTYDAMNNRETQVLPAYGTITYGYDDLNRLTSQSDSTGTIDWTLDGNGNATQTDYSFTTARNGLEAAVETATYNNQDLRSQYTDIAGLTTQWRYNNNDLVEEITYPNKNFTRFTFDARNRTASAIMKGGSVSYEYFNDDLVKKASYANGAESKYSYTPRNQVESIEHRINNALLSELGYTYDLNDNRKTETKNNGTDEVVTSYDFDDNDRIESIDYPAQYNELAKTVAYQFDAANNREFETTTQDSSAVTKTYVYNDLDQLTDITSTNTEKTQVEYGYDDNGNLAQKRSSKTINNITQTETNDYAFDIRGQLKSVTIGGSSIGQFLYDDAGQRLRTQYNNIENGQPATQTHAQHSLYQGLKLISQYDISASNQNDLSINANYQFAGGMNIGRRAYNEDDTANNTQTYYHTDALGSVLATSKANKSIAARYDYDAWGKELNNTDTSNNPIGYTGHQMDRESENKTGLIYANARYLDPDTGRFLSFDPFEGYDDKPISLHRYMYAYQNPVVYWDPDGRQTYKWVDDAGQTHFSDRAGPDGAGSNKDQDFSNDVSNSSDDAAEQTRVQENRDQWERHRESFPKNSKFETTAENETGETSSKSISASEKHLINTVCRGNESWCQAYDENGLKAAAFVIAKDIGKFAFEHSPTGRAINCVENPSIDGCFKASKNNKNKERESKQYHSNFSVDLDTEMYFDSDSRQFNVANKQLINKLEGSPEFRKRMFKRYPKLKKWMKTKKDHSRSPPGLTWHHHETPGVLKLADRNDHARESKIYHPEGKGGRSIWGGGNPGRLGHLNKDGTIKEKYKARYE